MLHPVSADNLSGQQHRVGAGGKWNHSCHQESSSLEARRITLGATPSEPWRPRMVCKACVIWLLEVSACLLRGPLLGSLTCLACFCTGSTALPVHFLHLLHSATNSHLLQGSFAFPDECCSLPSHPAPSPLTALPSRTL